MSRKREPERLKHEIDELIAELWQVPRFTGRRGAIRPHVDCYSTSEPPELTVIVELPGVDPDEVQIVATGRTLLVAGQRQRPRSEGRVYQQMEIDYGPFERELSLADDVDTAGARATYSQGLLTIVLPLAKRPRPRGVRVPIEVRPRP
jgi:HSP20 family protein